MDTLRLGGTPEVAALMGVRRNVVTNWVKRGKLTPIGSIGRRPTYVFDLDAIQKDLDRKRADNDS